MCVCLLAAVLLSSPAMAAGRGLRLDREAGLFAHVWELLSSLMPVLDRAPADLGPDGASAKARGSIDPNGDPTTDARGSIDPNGQPSSTTTTDEGDARGSIDPNGHT
jgi:hypothetical protein